MFDFRRATIFCLGHRFSKHKITRCAKSLGGMAPWAPPGYVYDSRKNVVNASTACVLKTKGQSLQNEAIQVSPCCCARKYKHDTRTKKSTKLYNCK